MGSGDDGRYQRVQATYVGRLGVEVGIFVAVDHLRRAGRLTSAEVDRYVDVEDWFHANLPQPDFYGDGNSIGAVTWFRPAIPAAMTERLRRLRSLLDAHAVAHAVVWSRDPGTIVYADEFQVGVIPRRRREPTPMPEGVVLGPTTGGSKRGMHRACGS